MVQSSRQEIKSSLFGSLSCFVAMQALHAKLQEDHVTAVMFVKLYASITQQPSQSVQVCNTQHACITSVSGTSSLFLFSPRLYMFMQAQQDSEEFLFNEG